MRRGLKLCQSSKGSNIRDRKSLSHHLCTFCIIIIFLDFCVFILYINFVRLYFWTNVLRFLFPFFVFLDFNILLFFFCQEKEVTS